MREGLFAVMLDPYGDLSHYALGEFLNSLYMTACVTNSFSGFKVH